MSMPPNSSANALFLTTLREMLVQDQDMDDDGRPETLRLMFATPRNWLRQGASIKLRQAPTAFGTVSVTARSEVRQGRVTIEVCCPERRPQRLLLRARIPSGWHITGVTVDGEEKRLIGGDTVDLSDRTGRLQIVFETARG
jgi:hypothetical protein